MSYTINREFENARMDEIEERVRQALQEKGFGILSEIDVAATLQQKIGVTVPPYKILGACNPKMAHKAIESEPRIGTMLPCNVILRDVGDSIEVSAIDPVASMTAVDNDGLTPIAAEVRDMLAEAVANI